MISYTARFEPDTNKQDGGFNVTFLDLINEKPDLARPAYYELKAILTNSLRQGPQSQNRQAHPAFAQHLQGRILHLATVHPIRATKLQRIFDQITLPPPPQD